MMNYIYDIWFELEDIVEQGGPIPGGALVVNHIPEASRKGLTPKANDFTNLRDSQQAEETHSNKDSQQNGAGRSHIKPI
jgi:hypothetical protein